MAAGLPSLPWLLSELKRRKVFRAIAAYAVGAFGALQVVDVIGPALGWPDPVLTYLVVGAVGFSPVVISLAWFFDLRRENPLQDPYFENSSSSRRGKLGRTFALLVLSLSSSGILLWLIWPEELVAVADFRPGDRILVSECENTTGNEGLSGVLNHALSTSIRQSSYVEVVSHHQVRSYAESYLGRPGDTPVTEDLATEFAVRTGLKVVVRCSVSRIGQSYLVSAWLLDPRTGADLKSFSEEAEEEALLSSIDALSGRVRIALGEALVTVEGAKPLATVTTPSLEALISYTAALEAEAEGDAEEFRRFMELALSRDSLFARAHGALGTYHYFRGNIPLAEEHFRIALRDPARIADRDRLWIEAGWASSRGEYERAITLYTAYLERWPSDANGWYNLGTQAYRLGRCEDAGDAFRKALALDPAEASAYVNLASCVSGLHQVDSALAL